MGYTIREGSKGDMGGGGGKQGNNWNKFGDKKMGMKLSDDSKKKYGKEGTKKDATTPKRKPYKSGGMLNRDGEKTSD